MDWFDVKGQARAMRLLQMAFASGRMPHAWLFYGPHGVGKETLAQRFGRLLLCEQPRQIDPLGDAQGLRHWMDGCGECRSCELIEAGTHPDLHFLDRHLNRFHPDPVIQARKGLEISVEVTRHFLLGPVQAKALMGRGKVFVVREAELLSTAAQNALLKTLEEPPADTYIVLLSTAKDRLLPTTISRCQPVSFGPLDAATTEEILAAAGVGQEAAFYAALSEGRPGWALRLVELKVRDVCPGIGRQLCGIGSADPVQLAADWADLARQWAARMPEAEEQEAATDRTRAALGVLFVVLGSFLHDALRICAKAPAQLVHKEDLETTRQLADWGAEPLARMIKCISRAESAIHRNANVALTLEELVVRLAEAAGAWRSVRGSSRLLG